MRSNRQLAIHSQAIEGFEQGGLMRRQELVDVQHHLGLLSIYQEQLAEIQAGTFPRLRKRLASQPAANASLVTGLKALALEGMVRRERVEIDWADSGLAWLDSLAGEGA